MLTHQRCLIYCGNIQLFAWNWESPPMSCCQQQEQESLQELNLRQGVTLFALRLPAQLRNQTKLPLLKMNCASPLLRH